MRLKACGFCDNEDGSVKSRSLEREGWEANTGSSDLRGDSDSDCHAWLRVRPAQGRITGPFAKTIEQLNKAHKGKDKGCHMQNRIT